MLYVVLGYCHNQTQATISKRGVGRSPWTHCCTNSAMARAVYFTIRSSDGVIAVFIAYMTLLMGYANTMEAYQISKLFESASDFVQPAPTFTPAMIFYTLKRINISLKNWNFYMWLNELAILEEKYVIKASTKVNPDPETLRSWQNPIWNLKYCSIYIKIITDLSKLQWYNLFLYIFQMIALV